MVAGARGGEALATRDVRRETSVLATICEKRGESRVKPELCAKGEGEAGLDEHPRGVLVARVRREVYPALHLLLGPRIPRRSRPFCLEASPHLLRGLNYWASHRIHPRCGHSAAPRPLHSSPLIPLSSSPFSPRLVSPLSSRRGSEPASHHLSALGPRGVGSDPEVALDLLGRRRALARLRQDSAQGEALREQAVFQSRTALLLNRPV